METVKEFGGEPAKKWGREEEEERKMEGERSERKWRRERKK